MYLSGKKSEYYNIFFYLLLTLLASGCEVDGDDNLPRVSDQGLVMYAESNRHEDEDAAQIAAAVFRDGVPVDLVGGDVFEARTITERILLKDRGPVAGSYAASLPVDNSVQDIFLNVVHAPLEAREDRWYPIDLLNTDPGPGELVGKSATVSFPPAVTITGPLPGTVYTSINDVIDLSWVALGAGDTMRVLAAVECSDGLVSSSYGVVIDKESLPEIQSDDGIEGISLDKFIYDLNLGTQTIKLVSDAALVLLQELLNQLSAGNIDPEFLLKKQQANPATSECDIRLFLQRQRQGVFDVTFDDGTVVGSTSAEVKVRYVPPIILTN
jgi:hypothetical protein